MTVSRYRNPTILSFFDKVLVGDGCWEWQASKQSFGYGQFFVVGRPRSAAHRWSYEFLVGPIPDGLVLDHLCRNPGCVNPGHLEPVTNLENIRRGRSAKSEKTHCPQGHPYDAENTYYNSRDNHRVCRICHRAAGSDRYRRRKAEREAVAS